MKKILIDAVNISGGGAVQVALSVIQNASQDKRFSWSLAVSPEINAQIDTKYRIGFAEILVLESGGLFSKIFNASKIKSAVEELNPDLVYTVFGPAYWSTKRLHLQGFAHPLLIYPAGDWYNPNNRLEAFKHGLINPLKRFNFSKKCYYVVETKTVKNRLASKLTISEENIFVVHNSVSPYFKREISRPLVEKSEKIVSISVFVPSAYYSHKNLEIIPCVAAEIMKMGFSDFRFVFIIPNQSKGWKNILRVASQLGVEDKLITLGTLRHAQMASEYKKSDLVFLPTLVEASTAVYPESFMARKPLITSDLSFARELCGDGAAYIDPRNPREIAEKIMNLKSNALLRKALVKKGIQSLNENYPSPLMKWKDTLNVFKILLDEK